MSLTTNGMDAGTEKQPLNFVPMAPNVCLIPAPPPPTGPQGIPTPFPIMTTTQSPKSGAVPKVKHKGGKVCNLDTILSGIKGNEAGVGSLPPGMPKKDIITGENMACGSAMVGAPTCQAGGKSFIFMTSAGFGNHT